MAPPDGDPEIVADEHQKPRCFVAYPAAPADRAESIETAISGIRSGQTVDIKGWRDLVVSGRVIISAICDEIKVSDVFIVDVTGLNANVLFELGYAIAHKKRVWLLLNPHNQQAKVDFDKFELLTTIGYTPYSNSQEIADAFYRDAVYKNAGIALYDDLLKSVGPPSNADCLLYLRCDVNTEASMRIARKVTSGPIRSVIDDPQEVSHQSLAWYVQQATSAFAVVCHLLSTEIHGWQMNNAKQSLVAGLAHGLAKPLLILAHEPYISPLDYRDILRKHSTASAADNIFRDWSLQYIEQYEKRQQFAEANRATERAARELRDISVGEPVAEHESDSIPNYYVATGFYGETLRSKYSIVVGRKGTGKTATLFALTDELSADPRNHVCVIKPVAYELEGLLDILRQALPLAEAGYLIESLWKFLLYTELTKSAYQEMLGKPEYYIRTTAENALAEFVQQHQSLITPEFTARLEAGVSRLTELRGAPAEGKRTKISELLHQEMLTQLRLLLGEALQNRTRVAILVDNLDKAWTPAGDISLLSELLLGLLSVSGTIAEDFSHDAAGYAVAGLKKGRSKVNLSFTLFLRSDIYAGMMPFAKEPDKLPARLITWNDPLLLKRVIEERIKNSMGGSGDGRDWGQYFTPTVRGVPTWEYVNQRILPRPRDLIFLVKAALQVAVNRGHTEIKDQDFVDGEAHYSRYALQSLVVEAVVEIADVENLLVHFVGTTEIVTAIEIEARLRAANIPVKNLDKIISVFVMLTFLGLEVAPNRFEFIYDEQNAHKFAVMSEETANRCSDGVRRFRIHPAFHRFLEISNNTSPNQLSIGI